MTAQGKVPTYSANGLAARHIFYSGITDVHFFVEDHEQENLYKIIIKKLFPEIKTYSVFPLDGKPNVLAHARRPPLKRQIARSIYILDKDYDDLLGNIVIQSNIFYLDDYCIENSIIEEECLVKLAIEESPKIRESVVRSSIGFNKSLKSWMPCLKKLHSAFAIVQKHALGVRNCDYPPDVFVTASSPLNFDQSKVDKYIEQVVDTLKSKGLIASDSGFPALYRKAFNPARFSRRQINGKFLLKLFIRHMRYERLCGNLRPESVTIRLAGNSRLTRLHSLKRLVRTYLSA